MSTAIFENDNVDSSAQVIRSSMSVSLDDSGTPIVSFATNRGKGTGAQNIPVSEFREAVACLQEIADNGFEKESLEPSVSDTIRSTISCDDGVVSFRTRSGKGSKPARISAESFSEVVSLLLSTVEAVEGAGVSLSHSDDATSDDEASLAE